jgi:hypothetical protein
VDCDRLRMSVGSSGGLRVLAKDRANQAAKNFSVLHRN